ncbi:hypothetical protein M409DRAFT_17233 [Zasmidium cellare ATCC 36951]|uniref:DUF2241 domain-containing protein n=1 Tax=Zasmidium cellare ATCC 36951 TaxID=1080233 RepID=A0A6A6D1Q2_ZASCE|nr:uncharacterized protein M409DRAFT_17233 [Zasmidium cellare ATCC 36951]KAF2173291.1 hypothetical protein M409DRAFT_17233 [Zasmidium cellare ATCC 36951]
MPRPTTTPAPGQTSLTALIRSMSPTPDPTNTTYVFAHLPHSQTSQLHSLLTHPSTPIKMLFHEPEAWTLILPQTTAESEGLEYTFPCKLITLNVHSSLEAVGFLARVTTRLAEKVGTGVNPVSGFYHDHLFVPEGLEGRVVEELKAMASEEEEV